MSALTLYINPKVARPGSRPHDRPKLAPGECLYVPACALPPTAQDGTRDVMTDGDWQQLLSGVQGNAQAGTTWNFG